MAKWVIKGHDYVAGRYYRIESAEWVKSQSKATKFESTQAAWDIVDDIVYGRVVRLKPKAKKSVTELRHDTEVSGLKPTEAKDAQSPSPVNALVSSGPDDGKSGHGDVTGWAVKSLVHGSYLWPRVGGYYSHDSTAHAILPYEWRFERCVYADKSLAVAALACWEAATNDGLPRSPRSAVVPVTEDE